MHLRAAHLLVLAYARMSPPSEPNAWVTASALLGGTHVSEPTARVRSRAVLSRLAVSPNTASIWLRMQGQWLGMCVQLWLC